MIRVRLLSLRELLKGSYDVKNFNLFDRQMPTSSWAERYYRYARAFNPTTFYAAAVLFAALATPGSRLAFLVGVSLGLLGVGLYLVARRSAEGLGLQRFLPEHGREGQVMALRYELFNGGPCPLVGLEGVDRFSGLAREKFVIGPVDVVSVGETVTIEASVVCDGGMGRHRLGPLKVEVADPLGVFRFEVSLDEPAEISVYPALLALPPLPVRPAMDSFRYGTLETPGRGLSVNFQGIREYQHGDSIKHVAWKLSAKHGKLLVKEFERQVNAEVALLIEMNARLHAGSPAGSTWECAKDVALSLILQETARGNAVHLHSNEFWGPPAMNAVQAHAIIQKAFELGPVVDTSPHPLPLRLAGRLPRGTLVVYVAPLSATDRGSTFEALGALRREGHWPVCVLLDSASFVRPRLHGPALASFEMVVGDERFKHAVIERLTSLEIPHCLVSLGDNIAQALRVLGGTAP